MCLKLVLVPPHPDLPEKEAAAAKNQRLLDMHSAKTGEAVPSTVTNRHFFRPITSLSLPNMGHATNASSLATSMSTQKPMSDCGVRETAL